jgi:DNA polymerase
VGWNIVAAEQCIEQIKRQSMEWLEWCYGDALHVISGCLRAMYVSAPGKDFISTDYNSIEAVGLAELSAEKWRQEVFRTHGKIYEKSAEMVFGVSFEDQMRHRGYTDAQLAMPQWWEQKPANPGDHHSIRKQGKVCELALGYLAWVGGARAFGMPGTDEEVKQTILAWRAASPALVELAGGQERGRGWRAISELYGCEGMAVKAIQNEGLECPVMRLDGTHSGITYVRRGALLYCRLPSGRNLHYHNPQLAPNPGRPGLAISFEGWNTNPKYGPIGWVRMGTYAGKLVENVTQATCRDILRWACVRLEQRGYPVVMHTYDEIVCEIAEDFGSHEEFEGICTVAPPWAATWPIRAPDSWRAKRYRKG